MGGPLLCVTRATFASRHGKDCAGASTRVTGTRQELLDMLENGMPGLIAKVREGMTV